MPAGRKVPPRSLLTMRGGTPTPTLESATQKLTSEPSNFRAADCTGVGQTSFK